MAIQSSLDAEHYQGLDWRQIVSAGSLSAAARWRGIAQSTLSRLRDRLEDQLGARLVERSSRAFRLTEAGHHFIEGARQLVRDAQALSR